MSKRTEVAIKVGSTMRQVIIERTPVTKNDPDDDPMGFHFSLVPSSPPNKGWNASLEAWIDLLTKICAKLEAENKSYPDITVKIKEANDTLGKPLTVTRTLLVDKVMAGFASLAGEDNQDD